MEGSAPLPKRPLARELPWLAAILVVAWVLRFLFLQGVAHSPWFGDPQIDELHHHRWASALARGETFSELPFFRAPLYPWFLGLVYRFVEPDLWGARLVQIALGTGTCGLVWLLARTAFGDRVARLAGFGAALCWPLMYFDTALLIPVLLNPLHLLALTALVATARRPRARGWALAGALLGLAAITRPNGLLAAPFLALWVAALAWPDKRRAAGHVAALTLGTLLPILPITALNVLGGDDFVLVSSQAGVNFHIGNNPSADGTSVAARGETGNWDEWVVVQRERAEAAEGRPLKPSEISSYYARLAWDFVLGQPGRSLPLLGRKLLYLVSHREIPNNQDPHYLVEAYAPWAAYLVDFRWVGPLAALGWLLALRAGRDVAPLWIFPLLYGLGVAAFFVTARYRIPLVPVLLPLAGLAAVWLLDTLRARRWRAGAAGGAVVALAAVATAQVPPSVDTHGILARRQMGLYAYAQGDAREAERLLEEAVTRAVPLGRPLDPGTWYVLGSARYQLGELRDAGIAFENAVRIQPAHAGAQTGLGLVLARLGRDQEAAERFLLALGLDAAAVAPSVGFAQGLAARGAPDRARTFLTEAVRVRPEAAALRSALEALPR